MTDYKLNPKEKSAIKALERLAEKWPSTLMLFSQSGSLQVRQSPKNGEPSLNEHHIKTIRGIHNDGGDSD